MTAMGTLAAGLAHEIRNPLGAISGCVELVRETGLSGQDFALGLLAEHRVAVMPGESFGEGLKGWLRLSLTVEDALIARAADRIAAHAGQKKGKVA